MKRLNGWVLGSGVWVAIATTTLLFASTTPALTQERPVSGVYSGGLQLGVNPKTNIVTGYYENHTGWDETTQAPRFRCIFAFYATPDNDSTYNVLTWYPENGVTATAGELTVENGAVRLQLNEDPDGCWNVNRFASGNGSRHSLESAGNWQAIRVVAVEDTHFHLSPHRSAPQLSGLRPRQPLRLYDQRGDWVIAETIERPARWGWVQAARLHLAFPVWGRCDQRYCAEVLQQLRSRWPDVTLTCDDDRRLGMEVYEASEGGRRVFSVCWSAPEPNGTRYGNVLPTLPFPGDEAQFLTPWPSDQPYAQTIQTLYPEAVAGVRSQCALKGTSSGINLRVSEDEDEVQVQCYWIVGAIPIDTDGDYHADGEASRGTFIDAIMGRFPLEALRN